MGICMKAGAWTALKDRLPEIDALPVHERLDGMHVRYYWPHTDFLCTDPKERFPVTAIFLPNFQKGVQADLRQVRRPDALRRVMLGFCPLGDDFNGGRVDRLLQWVGRLDCFELTYGTTDEALDLLDGLSR